MALIKPKHSFDEKKTNKKKKKKKPVEANTAFKTSPYTDFLVTHIYTISTLEV